MSTIELTREQSAFTAALASVVVGDDPSQQLVAAKVRGLMRGYHARWKDAGYVPVAVEQHVEADLINVETGRKSRSFRIAGKLDVICEQDSRRILFDHKTTSHDIADPNGPFWRQLVVEGQPSHYMLLEWLNGRKLDMCIWDVIRKPGIRPKKLTKTDRAAAVASRKYFGDSLSIDELERLQVEETESVAMYEARLASECTTEGEKYFQRRGVPRLDSELHEYARELWDHANDIRESKINERHVRNSGACILYNSPCKFLGICSGHDSIDSDKWNRKQNVHRELPQLQGDGRDVLTNSRIRCFQTCHRKHHYEYGIGLEQVDEEERESLYFGTLMHFALEAWWKSFMGESNVNSNANGCAANGVAQPIGAASYTNDAGPNYW